MTAWTQTVDTTNLSNTTLVTTAETVVCTLTGISTPMTGRRVRLTAHASIISGASTTSMAVRIRRDSLTGTLVGTSETDTIPGAAGTQADYTILVVDTPAEVANATYVMTVSQTAASANGSVPLASMSATIHN